MLPYVTLTCYYSELEVIKLELEKLNLGDLEFTAHREYFGLTISASGKGRCEERKHSLKKFSLNHKGVCHTDVKEKGKAPAFVPKKDVDDYMANYRHQKQIGRRRIESTDS